MGDTEKKFILEFSTKGAAQAEADFKRVGEAVRRTVQTYDVAPIRRPNRSAMEQSVREEVAGRIRAEREAYRQLRVQQAADDMLRRSPGPSSSAGGGRAYGGMGGGGGEGPNGALASFREAVESIRGLAAINLANWFGEGILGMAKGLNRVSDLMSDSHTSAAEMVVELGKSIPVIGKFVEAGQEIYEFFTGVRKETEAIRLVVEGMEIAREGKRASADRKLANDRKNEDDAAAFGLRSRLAGLYGRDAEGERAADEARRGQVEIEREAEDRKKAAREAATAEIERLRKLRDQIQVPDLDQFGFDPYGSFQRRRLGPQVAALQKQRDQFDAMIRERVERRDKEEAKDEADRQRARRQQEDAVRKEGLRRDLDNAEADAKAVSEVNDKTEAAAAAARQQNMRARGQELQADLDAIRSQLAQELDALDKETAQHLRDTGGQNSEYYVAAQNRRKEAMQQKAQADEAAKQREYALKVQDATKEAGRIDLDIQKKANEARLSMITDSRQKEIEQIKANYAERSQELDNYIARIDRNVPPIQRADLIAKATAAKELARQAMEKQLKDLDQLTPFGGAVAATRESRFLTGRAEASREGAAVTATRQVAQGVGDLNKKVDNLPAAIAAAMANAMKSGANFVVGSLN